MRLFSHGRGNPDTEANRSLNAGTPHSNARRGRRARPKEEWPRICGESDQLIVLGDGRADHKGKGLTGIRNWQRKHCPAKKGREKQCQPHCRKQQRGLSWNPLRKRVFSRSPVLKNGTPGSVRGRFGQLAVLPRCAPSEAWRFLQGASPCGVRINHPLLPSVATATEEGQTEQVS